MKLRLESAIERSDSPEMTHDLTAADKEIDRLAATVDRLLVMARTLEEGGSTEIELHDAAERAAERWHERAATRELDVVGRRRPRDGAGERHRHRPDPGQPDRERHDVRARSDRRADGHRGTAGVRRGSRPRARHPGRGTRQGHRAVLSGEDRSPRRLRPGSRDRAGPRRTVGRGVVRPEPGRRRHADRGPVPCRLRAEHERRPGPGMRRDADPGTALGRPGMSVGMAGCGVAPDGWPRPASSSWTGGSSAWS